MGDFNIQQLPTVKYTVQVISMNKYIEMSYSTSKTFEKFIRDIKQGISKEIQKGNIDAILKYK